MIEPVTTTMMIMVLGKLTAVPVTIVTHGTTGTAAVLSTKALAANIAAAMF